MDRVKYKKYSLILGDGGVKAGFIAGAANELLKEYSDIRNNLHIMSGSSASVGNIIYYLSFDMKHPGEKMWTSVLSDKNFLKFNRFLDLYSNKVIYDIDYLVDDIFKKNFPLNEDKVKSSKINFYLPIQRADKNIIEYYTNSNKIGGKIKSIKDVDLYEFLRAANAVPFFYDKEIKIGKNYYVDAASYEPYCIDLPEMEDTKKIFILTMGKPSLIGVFFYSLIPLFFILFILPFRKRKLRVKKYLQYFLKPYKTYFLSKKIFEMEKRGEALVIYPKKSKIRDILNNSKEVLQGKYRQGENEIRERKEEINRFISNNVVPKDL